MSRKFQIEYRSICHDFKMALWEKDNATLYTMSESERKEYWLWVEVEDTLDAIYQSKLRRRSFFERKYYSIAFALAAIISLYLFFTS
jgi:hypothetical protein